MPESLIEIVDKLKRYYPLSLIEWVYEFRQFKTSKTGRKYIRRVLEVAWSRIEKELGEPWIREVISREIRGRDER